MDRLNRRRNQPKPERVTAALRKPDGVDLVCLSSRQRGRR